MHHPPYARVEMLPFKGAPDVGVQEGAHDVYLLALAAQAEVHGEVARLVDAQGLGLQLQSLALERPLQQVGRLAFQAGLYVQAHPFVFHLRGQIQRLQIDILQLQQALQLLVWCSLRECEVKI